MAAPGTDVGPLWMALAATPAALAWLDEDCRVRSLTPAAAALLGLEGDPGGRDLEEILRRCGDPEPAAQAAAAARKAASEGGGTRFAGFRPIRRAGGGLRSVDLDFVRSDGGVLVHLTVAPTLGSGDELELAVGRHAREMATLTADLAASEHRFRLLVDGVRDYAIIGMDVDNRINAWNRGGERIFGWTAAEVLGRDCALIFTPEDRAAGAVEQEIATAREHGSAEDDRWHLRKDGSRFFAIGALSAIRAEDGALRGFAKVVRDRTEQVLAEQRIRAERSLLEQVLDQMPVGVSIAEAPSGKLILHNRRAIELIGHAKVVGDDYRAYGRYGGIHPDGTPFRAEDYPIARALLRGEVVVQEEMRYRRGDGKLVDFLISASPVRDKDGTIIRAVSIFDDTTDRKRDRESLARVNRELEEFAYIASHDLQEPLRMVASYLSLLRRRSGDRLDEQSQQYVDHAVDGAKRMQRLVHHLLEFARIDRNDVRLEPAPVLQAVAGAIHILERAIDESGATVVHGDLPTVLCEPDHLVRLFQNLIGNAIKYSRPRVPPRVEITARREGGRWIIAVGDNGTGIAPADRDRIFHPFERAHGREQYPGTGLGLAIVRKIVDRAGGDVWVESGEGGVGSRFLIALRAVDAGR